MKKKEKVSPSTKKRVVKRPPMPIAEPFVVPPAAPVDQISTFKLDSQFAKDAVDQSFNEQNEFIPPINPPEWNYFGMDGYFIIGLAVVIAAILIFIITHPHMMS